MKKLNEKCPPGQSLTDFKLDVIISKVEGLEVCMFGDEAGHRDGMRIDVDRLKQSRATHNAVLWVIFTTLVGVAGTVIVTAIGG